MTDMQKSRTRHFKIAFLSTLGFSAVFLALIALFGRTLAAWHFNGVADSIFAVMALAAGSFLVFSFLPYFRGDRRWYSISALLTVVFFAGTVMLWQMQTAGGII